MDDSTGMSLEDANAYEWADMFSDQSMKDEVAGIIKMAVAEAVDLERKACAQIARDLFKEHTDAGCDCDAAEDAADQIMARSKK